MLHMDPKVDDEFPAWCQEKYRGLKPVEVKQGGAHFFHGMSLDFGKPKGACHLDQTHHVQYMLECFPVEIKGNSPSPE